MEPASTYIAGFLAVLLFSAFVKILTALCILRYGIGLNSSGFGVVVVLFSMALTLFVMGPQLDALGLGRFPMGVKEWPEASVIERAFRPFMEKNADEVVVRKLVDISHKLRASAQTAHMKSPWSSPSSDRDATLKKNEAEQPPGLPLLTAAFLICELRKAFEIGFVFLVPFLVIDLLVTNILSALGVVQISQAVVALPLKILLFVMVDGWSMVSEKLVSGYL